MSGLTSKRRYNSPRRQAQAEATRQDLLKAAERLFTANGYAATTLATVARDAGVSLATVTSVFGTKLALLNALIATTVRGSDTPAPLSERDWWRAALEERDPKRLIERYAANIRRIHQRTTDIFAIVHGAATVDPEIATLRRDLADGRLRDSHEVALALADRKAIRPGITIDRAADVIWALVSAELYRLLAIERGWEPDDYERWLATSLYDALLPNADRVTDHRV